MPLGKFVRSLAGIEAETARQAFIEFQDTGKHTEEQVFFVNCIVDYIANMEIWSNRKWPMTSLIVAWLRSFVITLWNSSAL